MNEGIDFATAWIDPRKLADYLLAEDHPEGGAKARFFLACGFRIAAPDELAAALLAHAGAAGLQLFEGAFGLKIVAEGAIDCPDGRVRRLRSVWVREADGRARFVTAYPQGALHADRRA